MATTTVRGAGRRKAAALASKHAPKIGEGAAARKRKEMAKDEIVAPVAAGTLSKRPTKPGAFASDAEKAGWTVKRIRKADGSKTVKAERAGEFLEMTWSKGEKFVYPGAYSNDGASRNVRNASEGRQILTNTKEKNAPNSVRKTSRTNGHAVAGSVVRELTKKVPFNPEEDDPAAIVKALRGKKLVWRNSITGNYEEARVPAALRHVKQRDGSFKAVKDQSTFITESRSLETLGRRMLNFCDPTGGYRALFLDQLVQVK